MKNIICILAIVFFITGCDSNGFLEKIGLKEKITNKIQIRNGIAYLPNSDEPFTGKYEEFYRCENGQKYEERNYKDGKVNGLLIGWYCNGQKRKETNYINGNINGLRTEWWDDGQKAIEANYINGKLNGLWTTWHYQYRQKYFEGNAINGKLNGLCTTWDFLGRKTWEGNYIDGYLNGVPNNTGMCNAYAINLINPILPASTGVY